MIFLSVRQVIKSGSVKTELYVNRPDTFLSMSSCGFRKGLRGSDAGIPALPGDAVQVECRKIFYRQHLGWPRGEGGDDFEIALAFVAHLHQSISGPTFRREVTEGLMIFVSAIGALQPAEDPVRAALSAAQVFDQIVFLQFPEDRLGAANETGALVPRYSLSKRG